MRADKSTFLSGLSLKLMPMNTYALLYILCVAFSQITHAYVEVDALCDIKTYTNPNSWSTYSPCDTAYSYPCAEWLYGVTCSDSHVTELWLSSTANGTLPDSIGDLTYLTTLYCITKNSLVDFFQG